MNDVRFLWGMSDNAAENITIQVYISRPCLHKKTGFRVAC